MKPRKEIFVNVSSARNSGHAPNGGYGWVIVAASFLCNVVVFGIAKSYGIFLIYFVDYYQSSKAELAWIGSLFIGCMLISGPLSGAMINAFGSRPVMIAGSLLSTAAFLISTQASNVKILICTYGIIGGVGFGLISTPAVVNVGFYFSSKRATATGIAMCGIGIGSFVIPSLTTLLLEFYDWKGTLILLSGLILNCIVFAALMRPLPVNSITRHLCQSHIDQTFVPEVNGKHHVEVVNHHADSEKKNDNQTMLNTEKESVKSFIPDKRYCAEFHNSMDDLQTIGLLTSSVIKSSTPQTSPIISVHKVVDEKFFQVSGRKSILKDRDTTAGSRFYSTKIISTDHDVRARISVASVQCCELLSLPTVQPKTRSTSSIFSRIAKCVCVTLKETFDLSILKEVPFLILCSAYVIGMMGLLIPYVFLPHNSITKGIDREKAAFLLPLIGIADLLGRLTFGYIADLPRIRPLDVNNVCVFVSGVSSLAIPFCFSYSSIVLVSILYGYFAAGYQCLPSILSVDMVGLEKLTSSFGLVCLFRGIGCIVGSPVAGSLFNGTGNYDMLFYMAGAFLITSASLTMVIPYEICHRQKSCERTISRPVLQSNKNNSIHNSTKEENRALYVNVS